MRIVTTDLNFKIYAIVKTYDDQDWNENTAYIKIFETEEEYRKARQDHYQNQEYTGESWHLIYKDNSSSKTSELLPL